MQISFISASALRGMTAAAAATLTTSDVQALTSAQFPMLTTSQILGLTTAQFAAISTTQIREFTSSQIAALSTASIAAFTTTQVAAFSGTQLGEMTHQQIAAMFHRPASPEGQLCSAPSADLVDPGVNDPLTIDLIKGVPEPRLSVRPWKRCGGERSTKPGSCKVDTPGPRSLRIRSTVRHDRAG